MLDTPLNYPYFIPTWEKVEFTPFNRRRGDDYLDMPSQIPETYDWWASSSIG